jgi:hypothetical protein
MKRKSMGSRDYLILRKDSVEYECAEAGAKDGGLWGINKLLEKGVEANTTLKDMLNDLSDLTDSDKSSVRHSSFHWSYTARYVNYSNGCKKNT